MCRKRIADVVDRLGNVLRRCNHHLQRRLSATFRGIPGTTEANDGPRVERQAGCGRGVVGRLGICQRGGAAGRRALAWRSADATKGASRKPPAKIGAERVPLVADVSTTDGATGFVAAAQEALGGLDILVTNGGGPPPGDFASTPLDAYAGAMELNLLSVVAMCYAAVPAMQAQQWGRVVAITSIAVRQPIGTIDPVEHRSHRRHRVPAHVGPRGGEGRRSP